MVEPKPKKEGIIQKIILALFGVGILVLLIFAALSFFFLSPVNRNYEGYTLFEVQSGWGTSRIADELEEEGLIRSSFFFKLFMLINDRSLYAGTYRLSQSMSVYDIIRTLNSTDSLENETLTITFIEGRRVTDFARSIATTFDFEEEEVLSRLSDVEFIEELIEQYWFLTDEILQEGIKQPLEGYLFPDTYNFRVDVTIDDIIHTMLRTMESRLEIFKEDIELSNYTVHEFLTLASLIELEVPTPGDRVMVSGILYNRLRQSIPLGLCVTVHYAVGTPLSEPLTISQINTCSPFNTRGICAIPGLPIGPIANPSLSSITAVVEPEEHDYLFFVSDRYMRMYYNRTYAAHNQTVRDLRAQGLWLE